MGGARRLSSLSIWIGGGVDGAVWQAYRRPARRGKEPGRAGRGRVARLGERPWAEKTDGGQNGGEGQRPCLADKGRRRQGGFEIFKKFRGLTVK